MRDAVALNADRWVAEQHVVSGELSEERAVALAHHDRDEVDGHLVPALPAVGHLEQRPAANQCADGGHPPPPVLRARRGQVDGEVPGRSRDLDVAVLQPVEQPADGVVLLGDVPVEGHDRLRHHLAHGALPPQVCRGR
jgi:hypothetical protein